MASSALCLSRSIWPKRRRSCAIWSVKAASVGWQLLLGGLMIGPIIPVFDHEPSVPSVTGLAGYARLSWGGEGNAV